MEIEVNEQSDLSRENKMHSLPSISNQSVTVFCVSLAMITMFTTTLAAPGSRSTSSSIVAGSTLYASDPNSRWDSPNKTFSISFIPYHQGTSTMARLAAVTYDNDPTIPIWVAGANTITGGVVDDSAVFRLLPDGNLELRYQNGSSNSSLVWQSSTAGRNISFATLEESGNLVLRNTTGSIIWSSFDNPTDTIVPSQSFTNHHTLRNGIYSFKLSNNGHLNLFWDDTILYYDSRPGSSSDYGNFSSPSISILPSGILVLDDFSLSSPLNLVYNSDYDEKEDKLRFVKLDRDGNLRIYSFIRGGSSKNITWSAVTDQCRVFGYCGNMGICSYNATSAICSCPSQNFQLIDPMDSTRGCKRKEELSTCPGKETMLTLNNAQLLLYPPKVSDQRRFMVSSSACKLNCLVTDACVASSSVSESTGWEACYYQLQEDHFVSFYQSLILPSTSNIKVCQAILPKLHAEIKREKSRKSQVRLLVVVVLVTIFGVVLLKGILWLWWFRDSPKLHGFPGPHAPELDYTSRLPIRFSYLELQRATKGFTEKLGVEGLGAVYKGVLLNGTIAAVKMLEGTNASEKQFMMELATMTGTHHLNLVRFIGFCYAKRCRLLVYEFMTNGSLDMYIYSSRGQLEMEKRLIFSWERLYNIALGAARGIAYLHEECPNCILHGHIKPQNILIDESYNAKVSDFGISGLLQQHKDHRYDQARTTGLRGCQVYMAPELHANLPTTCKSDVYSYGLVLLEIVSGRKNFEVSAETNNKKFSIWAYEEFEKGNAREIVDKRLSVCDDVNMEQAIGAIQVSFWCIQEQSSQRPMISKVVQMLEGVIEIHRPPNPITMMAAGTSNNSFGVSSDVTATGSSTQFSSSSPSLPRSLSQSWSQAPGLSSSVSRKNPESSIPSLLRSDVTTNLT